MFVIFASWLFSFIPYFPYLPFLHLIRIIIAPSPRFAILVNPRASYALCSFSPSHLLSYYYYRGAGSEATHKESEAFFPPQTPRHIYIRCSVKGCVKGKKVFGKSVYERKKKEKILSPLPSILHHTPNR